MISEATEDITLVNALPLSVAAKDGPRAIDIQRANGRSLFEEPISNQVDDDISKYGSGPRQGSPFSDAYSSYYAPRRTQLCQNTPSNLLKPSASKTLARVPKPHAHPHPPILALSLT
jgi:hypothetical protein